MYKSFTLKQRLQYIYYISLTFIKSNQFKIFPKLIFPQLLTLGAQEVSNLPLTAQVIPICDDYYDWINYIVMNIYLVSKTRWQNWNGHIPHVSFRCHLISWPSMIHWKFCWHMIHKIHFGLLICYTHVERIFQDTFPC